MPSCLLPAARRGFTAATVLAAMTSLAASILAPDATAAPAAPTVDPAKLAQVRDHAMASDWAYQRLADLTDLIGPRLTGSPGAAAAVDQLAAALRSAGIAVTLDPVTVPHWVRGAESAELVDFAGHRAGLDAKLVLTTLGSSSATPAGGLTAPVLVVRDLEDLQKHAGEVKGRIVLFNTPYNHGVAENGYAGPEYGRAGASRFVGPGAAAKLGAVAALVRSISSADYRLAHTGATYFPEGVAPIPAAAVSVEDALLIARLAERGAPVHKPVQMHLVLTPQTLPDVPSHNVIGEIPGTDPAAGTVLVSGHVDSWDLAQGAIDDGAGVVSAMATLKVLRDLGLPCRRTVRFVGWMNEENGQRGAAGYTQHYGADYPHYVAAIESDFGAGRPLGIQTNAAAAATPALREMLKALEPIDASVLVQQTGGVGSDIGDMVKAGVPAFEPLVDGRHYFDYHHTTADTLDKVDPDNLRRQVAVMAVMVYFLANVEPALPRRADAQE